VHHEPPEDTWGWLELEAGADLGDLRPLVVAFSVFSWLPGLAGWLDEEVAVLGVLAAADEAPGKA
jgi:hypothetical protein